MEAKETFNKREHSAVRWEAKAIKLSAKANYQVVTSRTGC